MIRLPILTLAIRTEADVVLLRQRARVVARLLGFDTVDQTRVATAVSEIGRNALSQGGGGTARFSAGGRPSAFYIDITDRSPGPRRAEVWGGTGQSSGSLLARRLMDQFDVRSEPHGNTVVLAKFIPGSIEHRSQDISAIVDELMRRPPESLLEELHQQHQELLAVLENLNRQQDALREANAELEATNRGVMALYSEVSRELDDTNRGVMALYAQLDDQAAELRRVSGVKDRFISYLSHEFRSPLNATLALSRLLLDRVDGPLTEEQETQVKYIRQGANDLLEIVNDLLDIAKIGSGRMELHTQSFDVDEVVGAVRGMFRPLASEAGLELSIEGSAAPVMMYSDRAKLGQILRNLLSNAIKYTNEGTVTLSVALAEDEIIFSVTDTGVGIAPDELEQVFRHFVQASPAERPAVEGTGLGLPLSRQLAHLLGGELTAESQPGVGSTFRLTVPVRVGEQDESSTGGTDSSNGSGLPSPGQARTP